jgi:hypothetical protein
MAPVTSSNTKHSKNVEDFFGTQWMKPFSLTAVQLHLMFNENVFSQSKAEVS